METRAGDEIIFSLRDLGEVGAGRLAIDVQVDSIGDKLTPDKLDHVEPLLAMACISLRVTITVRYRRVRRSFASMGLPAILPISKPWPGKSPMEVDASSRWTFAAGEIPA